MKLTIKTLDQKTFHIDFDDAKTVWDLKAHLCDLPEVGVQPDQQQLIYAGRVLTNDAILKTYSIDERKFLVVMTKKKPLAAQTSDQSQTTKAKPETKDSKAKSTKSSADHPGTSASPPPAAAAAEQKKVTPSQPAVASAVAPTATTPAAATTTPAATTQATSVVTDSSILEAAVDFMPSAAANSTLVHDIMSMGYPEADVRRALIASFNNPDRAIEYLIEGIPEFPEMEARPEIPPQAAAADTLNPLSFLRDDPRFNQMRRIIQQRPELLSMVLARIGETNPALLAIIREHQEDFIRMINEGGDAAPLETEDMGEDVVEVVLTEDERLSVDRLVGLGFQREIVLQAYIACDKNEEQTADFLCRHMDEN